MFRVEFRDRVAVLGPAEVLCFEPAGVLNTGNLIDESFTAPDGIEV